MKIKTIIIKPAVYCNVCNFFFDYFLLVDVKFGPQTSPIVIVDSIVRRAAEVQNSAASER